MFLNQGYPQNWAHEHAVSVELIALDPSILRSWSSSILHP